MGAESGEVLSGCEASSYFSPQSKLIRERTYEQTDLSSGGIFRMLSFLGAELSQRQHFPGAFLPDADQHSLQLRFILGVHFHFFSPQHSFLLLALVLLPCAAAELPVQPLVLLLFLN